MVQLFSIPAFFIVLREVLEACVVVGIVLAYLKKTGATQYSKYVWLGAFAGVGLSLVAGLGFGIAYWVGGNSIFTGNTEKIFEGVTFLVAAALLTWMILWIMSMGKKLQESLEGEVEKIIEDDDKSSSRKKFMLVGLVGFQVLREGIETFIFIAANAGAEDQGGWKAIPIPGVLAIVIGLLASYLVFRGMLELDILKFFHYSTIILIFFAAGLVSYAFHEIQEVDAFGPWKPAETRDWYNAAFWSTKECCHDKKNEFFAMLRALLGYQDTPTFVELASYFAYWVVLAVIYNYMNWSETRANRNKTAGHAQTMALWSLLFTFVGFVYSIINVTTIGTPTMTIAFILSIITALVVFDTFSKLARLGKSRRIISFVVGGMWVVMLIVMFSLHIAQLDCFGQRDKFYLANKLFPEEDHTDLLCGISPDNYFFFFSIIFNGKYRSRGREIGINYNTTLTNSLLLDEGGLLPTEETVTILGWPEVAAMSVSMVVTVFFFGFLAFHVICNSLNITSSGTRLTDDDVEVSTTEDLEGQLKKNDDLPQSHTVITA